MRRASTLFAGVFLAALAGGVPVAQAHSVATCIKQVRTYQKICRLSPTALLAGMCKVTETLKWCKDRKLHKEKFHK